MRSLTGAGIRGSSSWRRHEAGSRRSSSALEMGGANVLFAGLVGGVVVVGVLPPPPHAASAAPKPHVTANASLTRMAAIIRCSGTGVAALLDWTTCRSWEGP